MRILFASLIFFLLFAIEARHNLFKAREHFIWDYLTTKWPPFTVSSGYSQHSMGNAIDIPIYMNPYVEPGTALLFNDHGHMHLYIHDIEAVR